MKHYFDHFTKTVTLILAAHAFLSAKAQKVGMTPLAPVDMEVSYEMDQLCSPPNEHNTEGWREKSTLMLEIGKGMAHSYVVDEHQGLMDQFAMKRDKNRWKVKVVNIHALLGETFMRYPDAGKLTQIVNLDAAGVYQYVEPIPQLKWRILSKSKTILGYTCQCATVTFRGRDYEAWFTADIPLSYGPWKFQGLPGLILEVSDSKNEYRFTANGIQHVKGEKNIMMFDEEMRSIKRSRAQKMEAMLHKDPGAYAADYGISIRMEGGMEHWAQPYYPIEQK